MGTLIGLGTMANHQELTAIRAAGRSPWRIAFPVMATATIIGAALLLLQTLVTPIMESEIAHLHTKMLSESETGDGEHIWLRTEQHFVRVASTDGSRTLHDIEIYSLANNANITTVRLAKSALVLEDGRWLLLDSSESRINASSSDPLYSSRTFWNSALSPDQTDTLTSPVASLSPLELWRFVDTLTTNGLNAHRYRVQLWQQLSVPVSLVAMSLLGLPFVLGSTRSVPIARRIAAGGGVGIGLYLAEQLSGHAAILFELHPLFSSLLPAMLVLLTALWLISKADAHQLLRNLIKRIYSAVNRSL
jgi:lipopolysaccharide export system permease protein